MCWCQSSGWNNYLITARSPETSLHFCQTAWRFIIEQQSSYTLQNTLSALTSLSSWQHCVRSLTREMALLAPTDSSACLTRSISALLLWAASLPPFSSNPLAELIARAATWGTQRHFCEGHIWSSNGRAVSLTVMVGPWGSQGRR